MSSGEDLSQDDQSCNQDLDLGQEDQSSTKDQEFDNVCTDAGFPRFARRSRLESEIKAYCPACDVYFSDTKIELLKHFKAHKTVLPPCQYCKSSVHEYSIGSETKTFHRCVYVTDEPSPASTSHNIESDMNCNEI